MTLTGLDEVFAAHPYITVELISFGLVVMNVALKAPGSPFEQYKSDSAK